MKMDINKVKKYIIKHITHIICINYFFKIFNNFLLNFQKINENKNWKWKWEIAGTHIVEPLLILMIPKHSCYVY